MKVPDSQIAVTLYNLRDYCKTESDLDLTLDKVCAIGYQTVQVSGVILAPEIIKKQLEKHNLFCCAAHDGLTSLTGKLPEVVDKLKILECDFTALGCPPPEYFGSYAKSRLVRRPVSAEKEQITGGALCSAARK